MPKSNPAGKSSISAILGRPISKEVTIKTPTACVVCSKTIPAARIEALISMDTPLTKFTHVSCSTTTKIKGVYLGENGTSQIMLCDKLYDDSVRSVFRRAEVDSGEETQDDN